MEEEGMMEVEIPILQKQASGANAEVFKTYHNDYKMEMVLRIALEAELKAVMAGGYDGVFEIGKNFRNEGSDPTHHQEFTMLEYYKAFKGLDWNLDFAEKLIREALKIVGKEKLKIEHQDGTIVEIDFSGK